MYEKQQAEKDKLQMEIEEYIGSQWLEVVLKNLCGAIFITESNDTSVKIAYESLSLFNPFGRNLEQLSNGNEQLWHLVIKEDLPQLKNSIIQSARNKSEFEHIYRVYNSDGEVELRHIRGSHLPDREDNLNRIIHFVNDITQQMQFEAELHEKNSIIDFAMKNTDVNLWYFDYTNSQCQLTKSCQKAHEMPKVEYLENFPECLLDMDYVHPDSAELVISSYKRMRDTGAKVEFDAWFRKIDGSGWWCERNMLSPILDPYGKVVRAIGIGKDITSEKELEEKYRTFSAYRTLAQKNTLESMRMNLTTGWFGDYISNNKSSSELHNVDTLDEFFKNCRQTIPTKEEKESIPPISREYLLDLFSHGETSLTMEYRCILNNRRPIWIRAVFDMAKNPSNGDIEALYYTFDINYEKNMQFVVERLVEIDYEFLGLIDSLTGYLMVFGEAQDTYVHAANGSYYDTEMPRVFKNLIVDECFDESIILMARKNVIEQLNQKPYYICSFPTKGSDNLTTECKQWKFSYLDDSKSQILMARTDVTDIYTAERDTLTGLYNRQAFYRHAREMIDLNPDQRFLMLRFDIDRFKAYNDAHGVKAGDRLLARFGKTIRQQTWPHLSLFGHIQADHFCALFAKNDKLMYDLINTYYAWLARISTNYRLISSIGIYEITDNSIDVSLMSDRALLALKTVKGSYENKIAWYDDGLRQKLINEQHLADEMERAIIENQFILYFQPQVNYEDGSIIGAEALVRWQHPERGLIMPGEFIPLFETNGFILKLDGYVWEKACQYLRKWLDQEETTPVPVSVNISRCDIYDSSLCEKLRSLIKKYDLPISLLKLEITESAYMEDPYQLLDVVSELQQSGFKVEMDDFGAGYSSLNTLKDMPVDVIKLDIQFLTNGWDNVRGSIILSTIIRMARWLRIPIIAEGVETKQQADYLKTLSCMYMQGYLFAKPMPAKEFETYLHSNNCLDISIHDDTSVPNKFWSLNAQENLLANCIMSGAAILEYDGNTAEIVRANDRFYSELKTVRGEYLNNNVCVLECFEGKHREAFLRMIKQAISTGKESECQVKSASLNPKSTPVWTYNRMRMLGQSGCLSLLYVEVRNAFWIKETN